MPATPTTSAPATVVAGSDPQLEPGFPVTRGNSYFISPSLDVLVGNINDDPQLEIVTVHLERAVTPQRLETLALRYDGSVVPGWPRDRTYSGYGALGNLSDSPGLELLAHPITQGEGAQVRFGLGALTGRGSLLPGWPQGTFRLDDAGITMLADVDADGLDEIFPTLRNRFSPLKADGSPLPGWQLNAPARAVGDLDGDGRIEVVTYGLRDFVSAYHSDGTLVSGFPFNRPIGQAAQGYAPVVGDVDGDGSQEIVIVAAEYTADPGQPPDTLQWFKQLLVEIISSSGNLEHAMPIPATMTQPESALALGDLGCDGFPEIVVQTRSSLNVFKGDGTPFPGWPAQDWGEGWHGYSGPLIGDVDGDGLPDIVAIGAPDDRRGREELRVYDRQGQMLAGFPKVLKLGRTASGAIADVDLDGRNELIVASAKGDWNVAAYDELWMFDLHGTGQYGPVQWGQFRGGPQHQGYYRPGEVGCAR